ncbi:MAG: N-acetylmuramic acid 6-phosphate etherase [Gemmatimonadota bacterium]|uniref:N-acetylmuramic acid 6-phosphate etherase n=1 Tax=Candidatus Palauibacter scopulicola TaxID=3056741 RepID=UPI00238EBB10|nr:N-acetylmuramic acid 6-phosphate etherase [Candidatus Palauibacter scopulicola]MDE2663529.1 N-acetylmuramic acid 6-phosphate etherase [Candidatus Palauibacter scopulicola]
MDPRLTEGRNPRTRAIDRADSATIVRMIQAEDRAVPEAVASQADALARVIDDVVARFRRGGRLVYVGAGTSGRLGVLDAAECPPTFGVDPGLVQAIIAGGSGALVRSAEGAEDSRSGGAEAVRAFGVSPADLVLGIAMSGTTPYVLGALAEAASRGAGTGFLGCTAPPAEVAELAEHLILPLVGPEVIAGSTRLKAGTATKLVLNTITTGAMIRSGRVFENLMVDLRARSAKLVDRGLRIFVTLTGASREEARRALIRTGGAVKTALAMHALGVDRATAERYLDCADGFLGVAVERFGGPERPGYGGYPAAPGRPDGAALLAQLGAGPARLAAARAAGAAAEANGQRIPAPRTAWTPAQHAAHLADFERSAVRPRVQRWLAADPGGSLPTFEDWTASPDPPERGFETGVAAFSAERAATVAAVVDGPEPAGAALARRARIGSETLTLYQFLRGVAQHDAAHETRLRERVHPALLAEADG